MAILEHDAFMSDELRRVPLKELTNRLDSFRRVMTERDPAWKMAVITDKIDMYYFAGNENPRIDKRTFRTPNLGNRLICGLLKHLASRVHFLFFGKKPFVHFLYLIS